MSGTLYLHIGAPKAASTTLQKLVFPALARPRALIKPRLGLVRRPRRWAGEGT